jgi:uncharacterized glyoxalase superfamily protein PhnB
MAKLTRIAPELPAANLQKAVTYYERKLGFRVAMQMPDGEYAVLERDDIAIHLFENAKRDQPPVGIHIFTTEIESLHEEYRRNGALVTQGIVKKPWGNRDFRVTDEFGNVLKFTEPLQDE